MTRAASTRHATSPVDRLRYDVNVKDSENLPKCWWLSFALYKSSTWHGILGMWWHILHWIPGIWLRIFTFWQACWSHTNLSECKHLIETNTDNPLSSDWTVYVWTNRHSISQRTLAVIRSTKHVLNKLAITNYPKDIKDKVKSRGRSASL